MNTIGLAKTGCGIALAAALGGCGGFSLGSLNPWSGTVEQVRLAPADATTYVCEGGKRLIVRYLAADKTVMIVFPEREFRLDATPAGGYSNGSTTLTEQGDAATLEEAGAKTYTNCKKPAA
jgi:membrane-bound inhibitor of C-type lysozyme